MSRSKLLASFTVLMVVSGKWQTSSSWSWHAQRVRETEYPKIRGLAYKFHSIFFKPPSPPLAS